VEIYTIGYTQKPAERFFELLKSAGIKRVIDIRLKNTAQLAGFSKKDDLKYFLQAILGAEYVHEPRLAPTEELLDAYQHKQIDAEEYARQFRALLAERKPEQWLDKSLFEVPTVLLCAEPKPDKCHRKLVAEYLREQWGDVIIMHL
jgi:uncharacterized protein (DUF488 family)